MTPKTYVSCNCQEMEESIDLRVSTTSCLQPDEPENKTVLTGYTPAQLESDTLVLDTVLWFDKSALDTDLFNNNSDRIYCQSAFYEEISWSDEQAAALATKLYWVNSILAGKGRPGPKCITVACKIHRNTLGCLKCR